MTTGRAIHKRLQEIVSEIKRLEHNRGDLNEFYVQRLTKEADKLQRKYQRYHGFSYNPILYQDEQSR